MRLVHLFFNYSHHHHHHHHHHHLILPLLLLLLVTKQANKGPVSTSRLCLVVSLRLVQIFLKGEKGKVRGKE
jgi:hypothetical protein